MTERLDWLRDYLADMTPPTPRFVSSPNWPWQAEQQQLIDDIAPLRVWSHGQAEKLNTLRRMFRFVGDFEAADLVRARMVDGHIDVMKDMPSISIWRTAADFDVPGRWEAFVKVTAMMRAKYRYHWNGKPLNV